MGDPYADGQMGKKGGEGEFGKGQKEVEKGSF